MPRIVLMAPGGNIAKHAYKLQEKLGNKKHFQVVHGYMEGAVAYARKYLDEDVDVIIARGNTAKLMRASKLRFPIVTIPISNTEIINSIRKAKELCRGPDSSIGYIGLEDAIQGVQEFLEILNYSVTFYPVNSSRDIREQVVKAKSEGVTVVIGGIHTQQFAREQGIDSVLLESSLYSISQAYEHAKEVQRSLLQNRKKMEERNTLIDSISEGIVSISEHGRITLCNSPAQNFLRIEERLLRGARFDKIFKRTEAEAIARTMNGGSRIANHPFSIQGAAYELDINPVIVHKKSKGVIATIRKRPNGGEAAAHEEAAASLEAGIVRFEDLIGESLPFQIAVSTAKRFAELDEHLLLAGEFGAGKETFAACIHHAGNRASGLFVARNAAALTIDDMLAAHRGTLYLDEISELPAEMRQVALELAIRKSVPAGRGERRNADVRIIAGTTQDLAEATAAGRFDRRLYYALNPFPLRLPTLAERRGDIPELVRAFLGSLNLEFGKEVRLDPAAIERLGGCRWPGNILELKNLCRRLIALSEPDAVLTEARIGVELGDGSYFRSSSERNSATEGIPLPALPNERAVVINRKKYTFDDLRALDAYYKGKKDLLAEKLGVSRSTLWRCFKMMDEAGGGS